MVYLGLDRVYDELPHHLIYLSEQRAAHGPARAGGPQRRPGRPALLRLQPERDGPERGARRATPRCTCWCPRPTPRGRWTGRATERMLRERIPAMLEKVGLKGVRQHIRAERYFTAETWRDDFNVFRGAVFNLSHTWLQLGPLRPKVKSPQRRGALLGGRGHAPGQRAAHHHGEREHRRRLPRPGGGQGTPARVAPCTPGRRGSNRVPLHM